jgi:hypothetical protein
MVKHQYIDPYVKYYEDQAGNGMNVFRGASFQKGYGVGSFFGGLLRSVMPLIKSGARALGRQALSSGVSLLGDLVEKKPFKQSFKARMSEAGENLKRKAEDKIKVLSGSGLKRRKKRRTGHSTSVVRRSKTSKNKKNRVKYSSDIFS